MFFFIFVGNSFAASLIFNPSSGQSSVGSEFTVKVDIDSGGEQITSTDAYVEFDPSFLRIKSVTNGDFFPIGNNNSKGSNLHYIFGVIANPGEFEVGSGNIASIVFEPLKEGTTQIFFQCDPAQTETSKIIKNDLNSTNIIDCSGLTGYSLTISAASSGTTTTGTGTTTTNTTTKESVTTLPQTGIVDDLISYSKYGAILIVLGVGIRLFSRAA